MEGGTSTDDEYDCDHDHDTLDSWSRQSSPRDLTNANDLFEYVTTLCEQRFDPYMKMDVMYWCENGMFITTFVNIERIAAQYRFPYYVILEYLSVLFDACVYDDKSLIGIHEQTRIDSYIQCFHELFRPLS